MARAWIRIDDTIYKVVRRNLEYGERTILITRIFEDLASILSIPGGRLILDQYMRGQIGIGKGDIQMNLRDLTKTASDMSDEELRNAILAIRKAVRERKKTKKKITVNELQAMLDATEKELEDGSKDNPNQLNLDI